MSKVSFTEEAARRIVAATVKVEGLSLDAGDIQERYRGDDDGTQFFRLTEKLSNCGLAKGLPVELLSSGAGGQESCPDFVVIENETAAIRDIGSVVRVFRVSMKERPLKPLDIGAIVECDYRKPMDDQEPPFWRLVRVVHCDCGSSAPSSESDSGSGPGSDGGSGSESGSGSGSGSWSDSGGSGSGEEIEVVTDVWCEDGEIKVKKVTIRAVVVG
jgi:uncharacterized membrane protein YgcG